jgi:hypothetical protein
VKNIYILLLLFSISAKSTTYYVSPYTGNNADAGTDTVNAWATWQKAFTTADAGDTVYFRGGVWYSSGTATFPRIDPHGYVSTAVGHTGTAANPICFFNYPGETPILDCNGQYGAGSIITGIGLAQTQYLHFKGLTIRNVPQRDNAHLAQGISIDFAANLTFENMTIYNISGRGIGGAVIVGNYSAYITPDIILCDTTQFINCDFYNLCDSFSANPGNAADGIKITMNGRTSAIYPNAYWYLKGCRFWNFSDDGTDIGGHGQVVHDSCWSSSTQKYAEFAIEGNGFKSGGVFFYLLPADSLLSTNWRIFRNCLADSCAGAGFYDLDYAPYYRTNGLYYNNTSYNNSIGFMANQNATYRPRTTIYKNNIAYNNHTYNEEVAIYNPSIYTESNNTWDATQEAAHWPGWTYATDVTVTAADFISLTGSQIWGARQADGSLPEITFLRLASTSDLIDAGTYVGLDTVGSNADIGYDEYGTATDYGPPAEVATVINELTTNIWLNGATLHGNCNDDGGGTVTDKGICWSTSANPTITGDHYHAGAGTGAFSVAVTGLVKSTTYHIRSFAINEAGTAYSTDATFVTPSRSPVSNGGQFVKNNGVLIKIQ